MARSRLFNRNPMPLAVPDREGFKRRVGMGVGAWDKASWAWAQGKGPMPPMYIGTPFQRQLQAGTQQILGRTQARGGGGALLGGGATGGGPAMPQPYGGRTPAEAGSQAGAKIRGPLGPGPGTISRLAVTTMTGKRTPVDAGPQATSAPLDAESQFQKSAEERFRKKWPEGSSLSWEKLSPESRAEYAKIEKVHAEDQAWLSARKVNTMRETIEKSGRTPGMFQGQDGKMYGEEEMGRPAGARTALSDAEMARRRKKHEEEGQAAHKLAVEAGRKRQRQRQKEAKTVMSG